ncbi:MAG: hypothetical protein HONDAALG_02625 [Gammaproteobacteria bacterium]|nr:hypothetical protein [Gammaproteobacteria bacterium]
MPPVIFDDGRIFAPSLQLERVIKEDFVRAVRLKSVLATLKRLGFCHQEQL